MRNSDISEDDTDPGTGKSRGKQPFSTCQKSRDR